MSPILFNFIAWVLGFSDEPLLTDYLEVDEKEAPKVFSICQDLINVSSQGRNQTPKSLALAMAVRQISGCSGLINILHGLGHCVSLSSTMAYDSALAQLTINTSNIVPKDFIPGKHVNLVYDNIDFKEDSENQTHVTNGIIIQQVIHHDTQPVIQHPLEQVTVAIRKKQRTVAVPVSNITPYSIGAKKTPTFDGEAMGTTLKELQVSSNEFVSAHKLDLMYALAKMFATDEENPWPGWTGFNTLLRQSNIPTMSRVGYLPIVDASPTEYSTLNEVLKSGIKIMDKLRLQQTVVVFDEAVYAKIQHIRWKEPVFYDRFVVRLGEFHACMSFLSAISKLFQDGGLKVLHT